MSTKCNYSLSSGAATSSTTTCPQPKKKRLSGLISLKSRRSSQDFGFRAADDDQRRHGTTHDDDARSTMSRAAAWVWHTRGIGEAAVLPTKRVMSRLLRHDNLHTTNIASDHQALPHNHSTEEAHEMNNNILGRRPLPPHLPMSRFKAEAMLLSAKRQYCPGNHLSVADQAPPSPAAAAADRPAGTNISTSFFYDDLERSSLQELLDRKIDRPDVVPDQRHHADANKPLKPLSAIFHRIFKRLFNASTASVVQQQGQILAQISPATSSTIAKYNDLGNSHVHHVIHHHHHYYYPRPHDSPQHVDQPNHETVLRRRRRHSESSYYQHQYSQAQDFMNNITMNSSCKELVRNRRSAAKVGLELADVIDVTAIKAIDIPSTKAVDDCDEDDQVSELLVGGLGPKLVSTDHHFRQRRHSSSYCASSRSAAASSN